MLIPIVTMRKFNNLFELPHSEGAFYKPKPIVTMRVLSLIYIIQNSHLS